MAFYISNNLVPVHHPHTHVSSYMRKIIWNVFSMVNKGDCWLGQPLLTFAFFAITHSAIGIQSKIRCAAPTLRNFWMCWNQGKLSDDQKCTAGRISNVPIVRRSETIGKEKCWNQTFIRGTIQKPAMNTLLLCWSLISSPSISDSFPRVWSVRDGNSEPVRLLQIFPQYWVRGWS